MTLTYLGKTYECVSAEKKQNEIIIHTGEVADGDENVYHIYGDINFDEVVLEGGTWTIPAPHNIMEGECVTINNVMYKAIANIPNGEPIIVGQNAVVTTIEEQLAELAKGE